MPRSNQPSPTAAKVKSLASRILMSVLAILALAPPAWAEGLGQSATMPAAGADRKVIAANPPAGEQWGPEVEGMRIRLLGPGECYVRPELSFDARNAGKRVMDIVLAPEFIDLEVDGQWLPGAKKVINLGEVKALELGPQTEHKVIPAAWPYGSSGQEPVAIKPGKHTLRLAIVVQPEFGQALKAVRLVSNPIEVVATDRSPRPTTRTRPASPRPTIRKPIELVIVRVYDARDLITPIPDMQPPPVWSSVQPASRPAEAGEKTLSTRERLLVQLINLIRQNTEPSSWTLEGSIHELNGSLIITQTEAAHGRIIALLQQLRDARYLQVAVNARFIRVPAKDDKQFQDWMRSQLKCALDAKTQSAFVSAADAKAFFDHAQELNWEVMGSPRLTLFNGLRAYIAMGNQVKFMLPLEDRRQVEMTFQNGASLDICATVSADRKYATLQVAPTLTSAPATGYSPPYDFAKAQLTASLPDDGVLVLRMPLAMVWAVGAKEVVGPGGRKDYEVATRPADPKAGPSEYVYVLVHAKIIQLREEEETQFPRIAPTSRPTTDSF